MIALLGLFVALSTAGIGLFLAGMLPYAPVKAFVDGRSSDGHAAGFNEPFFTAMVGRMQWAGLILLAYVGVGWYFRRRVVRGVGKLPGSMRRVGLVYRGAVANWWRTAPRWERLGLVTVVVVGLVARWLYLGYPLRHDEAFTVEAYARTPFYRQIADLREPNNHFLHTMLAGLSLRVFGDVEWAVRIPALLAGWLTIPAAFVLFRRCGSADIGFLGAGLLAVQSAHIEYSVLARGYSIVTFLFLIGLLVVADWPARPASRVRRWTFTLVVAAGLCTVLSSLYMAAVLGCWFLLRCWEFRKVRWRAALVAMAGATAGAAAIMILFYLPAGMVYGPETYFSSRFVQSSAYNYVVPKAIEVAGQLADHWGSGWPPIVYRALVGLSMLGVVVSWRRGWGPLPILAIAVCVGLTLLQKVIHFPRSFLFLSPLLLGSAAWGTVWLLRRTRIPTAAPYMTTIVMFFLLTEVIRSQSVYLSNEIGNARDIREAAAFLRGQGMGAGDHVSVTLVSSMPAVYYFRKTGIPASVLEAPQWPVRRVFALEDTIPHTGPEGTPENQVMSNMELVLRVEGFDTERMGQPRLLWQSRWSRIWLYANPEPLW